MARPQRVGQSRRMQRRFAAPISQILGRDADECGMVRYAWENLAQAVFCNAEAKSPFEHRCGLFEQNNSQSVTNSRNVRNRTVAGQRGLTNDE